MAFSPRSEPDGELERLSLTELQACADSFYLDRVLAVTKGIMLRMPPPAPWNV